MTEFYIYELSIDELALSRRDVQEAIEDFGLNTVEFCECMLARTKAWANLIATDWEKARKLKIRDLSERNMKAMLMPYEIQEYCHQSAIHAIIMWATKMRRAERLVEKREQRSKKGGEA